MPLAPSPRDRRLRLGPAGLLLAWVGVAPPLAHAGPAEAVPASGSDAVAPREAPGDASEETPEEASATEPESFFVTEVAFGTSIGIAVVDPRPASQPYEAADHPGFVPTQWTPFAINGELWVGRHVPAFDFVRHSQARADAPQNGVATQLRLTLTELSYGYAVWSARGFSFVPRAGLGLMDAEQRAQATGAIDFDDALEAVGLGAGAATLRLQKTSMVFDLGFSLSYLAEFGRKKSPPKPGLGAGIRIGLRLGGLVQLFDLGPQGRAWTSEGEPVRGAPDMRLDGFYLRLFVAPSLLHRSRRAPRTPMPRGGR